MYIFMLYIRDRKKKKKHNHEEAPEEYGDARMRFK